MDLSNPLVQSMIRQLLTSMGAAAITAGYLTSGQLEQVIGGLMVLVSMGWSYFKKPVVVVKPAAPVKK